MTAKTEESYEYARLVGKCEGILVWISSGSQAIKVAQITENNGKTIVVLFPDSRIDICQLNCLIFRKFIYSDFNIQFRI